MQKNALFEGVQSWTCEDAGAESCRVISVGSPQLGQNGGFGSYSSHCHVGYGMPTPHTVGSRGGSRAALNVPSCAGWGSGLGLSSQE